MTKGADVKNRKKDETVDSSRGKVKGSVAKYKKRMLEWPNPVEFVNNMYACHPGEDGSDYFETVFGE